MFRRVQNNRRVILYFGGRCARRGYDKLLHLCSLESDTVFVSCGRPTPSDEAFKYDVSALREALQKEGRIFEVDTPFLPDNAFTDMLFNSAPFVLLPYDDFMGSSGVLVQAASYGKPVLVADLGHMGSLVKRGRIGLCYKNRDEADFLRLYRILCDTAPHYIEQARVFAESYSSREIDAHLSRCLLGSS